MKNFLKTLGAVWVALTSVSASPAPLYHNAGINPDPVMIDATTFLNTGTFIIGSPSASVFGEYLNPAMPFTTQNTLYYTNTYLMSAIPGFSLQYVDPAGIVRPAASIYNGPGATISAEFSNLTSDLGRGFPSDIHPLYGGYLTLNATNIVNRGSLAGFYSGAIEIRGSTVDLSGSKVGNAPLNFSTFSTFQFTPNIPRYTELGDLIAFGPEFFSPETDNVDIWWRYGFSAVNPNTLAVEVPTPAGTTNLFVNTGRFGVYLNLVADASPDVTDPPFAQLVLRNPDVFVYTNQPSPTNKLIEIVFVDHPDTNVVIDVSWQEGPNPDLPSRAAFVRFTTIQPDLVTQGVSTVANQFVIVDNFGPEPNPVLLINGLTVDSQAPTNIFAFRAFPPYTPGEPIGTDTTNSAFTPLLLTTWFDDAFTNGMEMTNQITTNLYVTYAGRLQPFPSKLLNDNPDIITDIPIRRDVFDRVGFSSIPGSSITNVGGRVSIDAKDLNLRGARIQGQGAVTIRTDNLRSSRGAVIDAPILDYDLGATNNRLVIRDLAKGSVTRFGGTYAVWSTTFTNSFEMASTNGGGENVDIDGDGTTDGCDTDGDGVIDAPGECTDAEEVVNTYTAVYHVTVIANNLNAGGRSLLNNLRLRADNVDIQDEIVVDGTFSTTATNLFIAGTFGLPGITNFTSAQVPRMSHLEVAGALSAPSFIGLGLPPAAPLAVLDNSGTINSTAVNLNAVELRNRGTILAEGGDLIVSARNFLNSGGSLNSVRNVFVNASVADLAGLAGTIGGTLNLNVTDEIKDGGVEFPGFVETTYGLNLPIKPTRGDLLGSTFSIVAPEFVDVVSFWAGEDRGATRSGFTNNAAVGALVLDVALGGVISFMPMEDSNAIYVELLEISDNMANDLTNSLVLGEGMTLYFATTSENVDPADLDGFETIGGGTLRWVKDGSSPLVRLIDVITGDGRTLRVPRTLRFSATLDSDGDGVVNAQDVSPFDLVVVSQVTLTEDPEPTFEVQWNAAAGQTYEVQATSSLVTGQWSPVKKVTNATGSTQRLVLRDPVDPGAPMKAYRVVVSQP